jgi:hypothetical protein
MQEPAVPTISPRCAKQQVAFSEKSRSSGGGLMDAGTGSPDRPPHRREPGSGPFPWASGPRVLAGPSWGHTFGCRNRLFARRLGARPQSEGHRAPAVPTGVAQHRTPTMTSPCAREWLASSEQSRTFRRSATACQPAPPFRGRGRRHDRLAGRRGPAHSPNKPGLRKNSPPGVTPETYDPTCRQRRQQHGCNAAPNPRSFP